jgi:hypothetical protein
MSLNAADAVEYSHGLRKPRAGFPAASNSLLRRAMTLAKIGEAMLVPTA